MTETPKDPQNPRAKQTPLEPEKPVETVSQVAQNQVSEYRWHVSITREDGGGRLLKSFEKEEDMKLFVSQQVFDDPVGKYVDVFFGKHYPLSNLEKRVKVGDMELRQVYERPFFDGFVDPN